MIYDKTYRDLLSTNGEFNIDNVLLIAYKNSPDHYTKVDIKRLAIKVLDEALENGMVKIINPEEWTYESIFSEKKNKNVKNSDEKILNK